MAEKSIHLSVDGTTIAPHRRQLTLKNTHIIQPFTCSLPPMQSDGTAQVSSLPAGRIPDEPYTALKSIAYDSSELKVLLRMPRAAMEYGNAKAASKDSSALREEKKCNSKLTAQASAGTISGWRDD
jgi:hypothetical protein